ncbi:NAD-dependent deacylase [Kaistella sp. PBT33-4]|uniref:Sir2 family NAD-dependent protein deacetylase n=1 Tax=Kaistella sp. PBT33-4 TaxID=3032000 RepID=UPI0023D83084|nr:Sir2 family NAD-dependent protein deacetylase [Kaistella sp. PBT33-4]MDF0720375.1 NAD-dependent deacylase [Kaistella sp. PBT33-4]
MKKNLVVLSGAGISAESGVRTFRDSNGLWENHRIEDVATPEGFAKNPQLVLNFYNERRRQLNTVKPNEAHRILVQLEKDFHVQIITQNVDDLHERAGSSQVLHLHGELKKVRPVNSQSDATFWEGDLNIGDTDAHGNQLRPHIVWFGEEVPAIEEAQQIASEADIFLIIGTSLQVYPAAGLLHSIPDGCELFVIDPHLLNSFAAEENFFKMNATEGMRLLLPRLNAIGS